MEARLAIYRVWKLKSTVVLRFTECGSQNQRSICYLQSVGAKTQLHFSIYKVLKPKPEAR